MVKKKLTMKETALELEKFLGIAKIAPPEYWKSFADKNPKSKSIKRICLNCNQVVIDVVDHIDKRRYICKDFTFTKENALISWLKK